MSHWVYGVVLQDAAPRPFLPVGAHAWEGGRWRSGPHPPRQRGEVRSQQCSSTR